jgi:hypothetical protein
MAAAITMPDEELGRLMDLIKDADSVELKLTIPLEHQRATVDALGMDPLEAQIRQVFFFDTPDLALDKAGVVVRARRIQGKGDDSVVKLRPVVPAEMPAELRQSENFKVEVDAMPGGFVCSGSLKYAFGPKEVKRAVAGKQPVRKLFSKEQRRFFAEHAPEGVTLDDLSILGPLFVLKARVTPPELDRRIVGELWLFPDGSRVAELSTRAAPNEAFQVAGEARAHLAKAGIDLTGEQQTKTRKALKFFAKALDGEAE